MEDYCKYQQRLLEIPHPFVVQSQNTLLQGLNNLISFLGLKSFWIKTYYGLNMQVVLLRQHGQQIEALNLIIQGLNENQFWGNYTAKWWHLMHIAVSIAQDLSLNAQHQACEPLMHLLKLSMVGPQPWQGYHVAYSFASFSLWSFQFGKTQRAIEQVNIAIHADPSWGYPEYLLGWYGLVLEGIDPVPHFVKAIHINWSFFQRLRQDPFCQRFPDVLQAVQQQILVKTQNLAKSGFVPGQE